MAAIAWKPHLYGLRGFAYDNKACRGFWEPFCMSCLLEDAHLKKNQSLSNQNKIIYN
jgi:hypothetical protein